MTYTRKFSSNVKRGKKKSEGEQKKKKSRMNSSYKRPVVSTAKGMKAIGSGSRRSDNTDFNSALSLFFLFYIG
jgi:hypothetical protein